MRPEPYIPDSGLTVVGAAPAPGIDLSLNESAFGVSPRTKSVFLDNPNNPCGRYVPAADVERLRDGLPADNDAVIVALTGFMV